MQGNVLLHKCFQEPAQRRLGRAQLILCDKSRRLVKRVDCIEAANARQDDLGAATEARVEMRRDHAKPDAYIGIDNPAIGAVP